MACTSLEGPLASFFSTSLRYHLPSCSWVYPKCRESHGPVHPWLRFVFRRSLASFLQKPEVLHRSSINGRNPTNYFPWLRFASRSLLQIFIKVGSFVPLLRVWVIFLHLKKFLICKFLGSFTPKGGGGGMGLGSINIICVYWALHSLRGYRGFTNNNSTKLIKVSSQSGVY
jgi:hypothetical protein